MDDGYKNTLGSGNICSYNRYKIYNSLDMRTVFQKIVLITESTVPCLSSYNESIRLLIKLFLNTFIAIVL